jgi:divalent metal cation (Fe/Co/Zn/Cd) transporter
VLAGYLVVESGRLLLVGARAETSIVGLAITFLSLLGSRALRADAHETIVCAWLSFTTLLGLGLNAALGWWWADPVAALAMVPLVLREGLEAWRGEPVSGAGPST